MQSAKIQLSSQHIKLVTNAGWILTKNEILQHIKMVFGDLYTWQQFTVKAHLLPADLIKQGGKISKGENYLGLPWIVLDYPRHFVKNNVFAIRTLFWWGRFFSTTLHLSGDWQQKTGDKLISAWDKLRQEQLKISYSGDEWIHDLNHESYKTISSFSQKEFEKMIKEAPFIKIAAYTSIENIENATEILMQQFEFLTTLIGDNS